MSRFAALNSTTNSVNEDEEDDADLLFGENNNRKYLGGQNNNLDSSNIGAGAHGVDGADDCNIKSMDEFRIMLLRHWSFYDSMYHSSYVATRLGIWKERGRQRLTSLLVKMGYLL